MKVSQTLGTFETGLLQTSAARVSIWVSGTKFCSRPGEKPKIWKILQKSFSFSLFFLFTDVFVYIHPFILYMSYFELHSHEIDRKAKVWNLISEFIWFSQVPQQNCFIQTK